MKHIRRFSFILILSLILPILSLIPAQASFDEGLVQSITESYQQKYSVNVAQYGITEDDMAILFEQLRNSGRLPWYAANTYEISYDQETGKLLRFFPHFLDEEDYDYIRYEQRVQEVITDCIREGMSQWQKVLVVHDYLAANCRYDESYLYSTGYDLLVNGTAVCRGYAEAYMDIMNRLGIPCRIVSSDDMDHCWNLVNIEGSWYHVDVTWDDSIPDSYGMVLHDYLLVTDREMQEDHQASLEAGDFGHYNWETDITCTDEGFTDAFWKGVNSQICYPEASLSYLRREEDWNSYLYARNENTGEEKVVFTEEVSYISLGEGQHYAYAHNGLSLWNGYLYFSSVDTVYAISPDGSNVVTVYNHDTENEGTFIYSSFVKNDTLYLTLSDHNYHFTSAEFPLESTGYHSHHYRCTVVDATCTEDGLQTYSCDCGITVEAPGQEALGHSYELTVLQKPTFWRKGIARHCCQLCGSAYEDSIARVSFWKWLLELLGIW